MFYKKVVAIDDNSRSLDSMKLVLQKHCELICFPTGEEGLEYLRKPNSAVLVLVDVFMRGMDGIDVLHEVKKINKNIAVIVMTAFGSKDVILQALRNGADDFIEKPFDVTELRDKVQLFLSQSTGLSPDAEVSADRMKYFVDKNVAGVSLKDLAQDVYLSEKYVSRLFKEKNNCGFRDYKIKVKIERAKDLLENSSQQIYQISRELGYQNPETFMRLFKDKTGFTPLQYRNRERNK